MREPGKVLAFGPHELDFGRGELRRGGKPVAIQPTPLRVLLHLAEQRDRTVSRRELLDVVWPNVVVGEDALTTALAEARHAVGDDGAGIMFFTGHDCLTPETMSRVSSTNGVTLRSRNGVATSTRTIV